MSEIIPVSSFYTCDFKKRFRKKCTDKTRIGILYEAVSLMASMLGKGCEKNDILVSIRNLLCVEYRADMFSFEHLLQRQIDDDVACFGRYLDHVMPCSIRAVNVKATYDTGDTVLCCTVPLVIEKEGRVSAHLIFPKHADKSPRGKSCHTVSDNDLYALIAKGFLEDSYPGIDVCLVYLFSQDDRVGEIGAFKEIGTVKSNLFKVSFEKFVEDGALEHELLKASMRSIMKTPLPKGCFSCDLSLICKEKGKVSKSTLVKPKAAVSPPSTYVMPNFTSAQKEIISHKDGPLLVCACPGSGKTASLIGWIKARIDEGVAPEFILAVTFTRDAAGEIAQRCASFCNADEMPRITTLNAFCYGVLKDNKDIVGDVKLLSDLEKIRLIDELLDGRAPLRGFSYAVKTGRNGLLKTVANRLDELSMSGQDEFMLKHKDIGKDFIEFAGEYRALVKSAGYISFDEQISLCLKLFKEHPYVLLAYQRMYKYVLVDEYQDVNMDQANLVYLLSKEHGNIIAIGDDDQSIYAFRGGSNKYMLKFAEVYKGAKTIVLTENFRSTETIVEAARSVIQKNKKRIDKEFVAVRKGGRSPVYVEGTGADKVSEAVNEAVRDGYGYGDIAVLSSKNDTLEQLSGRVAFPCVMGKSFLINEPSFNALANILSLSLDGVSDKCLLSYYAAFGEDVTSTAKEHMFSDSAASCFLRECMEDVANECSVLYLTDKVLSFFGQIDTAVDEAVSSIIEDGKVRTMHELRDITRFMIDYGDGTRLTPDTSKSVLLSTSHESKGLEWPVVIMIDDYKKDGTDESNRLYYVAMTRAKDRLYILRDNYNQAG